jgi:hypothetical protein
MRQRVVAILMWPLRFLRRLLGLALRPFGLLRKVGKRSPKEGEPSPRRRGNPLRKLAAPFRKLAALQGRPRIAAFVIIGVVVVVAVLALRPGPNEEKGVRATLDRYAQATRAKDYQTLCDDLFARDIVSGLTNVGLPCEVALRNSSFETVRNPQLTVLGVEVSGDQALARARSTAVGETASLDTIKLVKQDGGWRIASLSEPGAAAGALTP